MSCCPRCSGPISRSAVLDASPKRVVLFCTCCEKCRDVPSHQRQSLSNKKHHPFAKERIESLQQVGFCDLIQLGEEDGGAMGVCTEVDRSSNALAIVEWKQLNQNEGRGARRIVTLEELRRGAFVFRFMPLDCLRLHEVLRRAREGLQGGAEGSSERFANWMKTGRRERISIACRDVTEACPSCSAALDRSSLEGRTADGRSLLLCAACGRHFEVLHRPGRRLPAALHPVPSRGTFGAALLLGGIAGGLLLARSFLPGFAPLKLLEGAVCLPAGPVVLASSECMWWIFPNVCNFFPNLHDAPPLPFVY